jgi:two-component system, NtrC family, nitrogen regulation sensor histidine kinase NtrY
LPGALGPFELRVQPFRYRGRPHTLLVMTSVGRLLREEERRAHRQIISVLSHEINNSLAPIKSLAGRLQSLTAQLQQPAPDGAADADGGALDDIQTGLTVIARRSGHLAQVMSDYARLARSPEPFPAPIRVRIWIERNVQLWPGVVVSEASPDELSLCGDEALLDQVLLNLIKNALEATAGARSVDAAALPVSISWHVLGRWLAIVVSDRGCGLPDGIDPFLPFVSSKPDGSGIGLALCRDVAEAHGGRLELVNRSDGPGCLARLTLPLEGQAPPF